MSLSIPPAADAEAARASAASILKESRFHSPSLPRPFHGVLHAIGEGVSAAGKWVVDAVARIGRVLPGGAVTVWVLLGIALVVGTVLAAQRYSRRALLRERRSERRHRAGPAVLAADLARAADHAERDGRYADAVRLRFRAGLAQLAERGAIRRPRSTVTAELARTLRSEDFDALARRFDEIVYGSAPAAADDAEEARRRWAAVVGGSVFR